nr:uncharacterized protein LOC111768713 [Equus caballus]
MTVATHLKTESQGNDRRCSAIRSWRTHAVWADFPPPGSNTEGRGNCPQERVSQLCTDPLVDKCLTAGKQRLEANVPELCRQKRSNPSLDSVPPRRSGRSRSPARRGPGLVPAKAARGARVSFLQGKLPAQQTQSSFPPKLSLRPIKNFQRRQIKYPGGCASTSPQEYHRRPHSHVAVELSRLPPRPRARRPTLGGGGRVPFPSRNSPIPSSELGPRNPLSKSPLSPPALHPRSAVATARDRAGAGASVRAGSSLGPGFPGRPGAPRIGRWPLRSDRGAPAGGLTCVGGSERRGWGRGPGARGAREWRGHSAGPAAAGRASVALAAGRAPPAGWESGRAQRAGRVLGTCARRPRLLTAPHTPPPPRGRADRRRGRLLAAGPAPGLRAGRAGPPGTPSAPRGPGEPGPPVPQPPSAPTAPAPQPLGGPGSERGGPEPGDLRSRAALGLGSLRFGE